MNLNLIFNEFLEIFIIPSRLGDSGSIHEPDKFTLIPIEKFSLSIITIILQLLLYFFRKVYKRFLNAGLKTNCFN